MKNDESPENPWPQSPDRHESFENSLNLASGLSSSAPIHGVPTGQSHGAETNNSPLNFGNPQFQQAQQERHPASTMAKQESQPQPQQKQQRQLKNSESIDNPW